MGWSRIGFVCPNHPFHDQRQGVCPSCLREKLSDLRISSFRHGSSSNTAALLFPASSLSSEPSSPSNRLSPGVHRRRRRHHRNGSEVLALGSMSFRFGVSRRTADDSLKKSHSVAFVSRNRAGGEDTKNGGKKGKKGFWSKLLHLKGKKELSMDGPEDAKEIKVKLGNAF